MLKIFSSQHKYINDTYSYRLYNVVPTYYKSGYVLAEINHSQQGVFEESTQLSFSINGSNYFSKRAIINTNNTKSFLLFKYH